MEIVVGGLVVDFVVNLVVDLVVDLVVEMNNLSLHSTPAAS